MFSIIVSQFWPDQSWRSAHQSFFRGQIGLFIPLLLIFGLLPAQNDVRLPRCFGDHMVLQQNQNNPIWGWAKPGQRISIQTSWGANAQATTDKHGRWQTLLPTPAHGTGHRLTVRGQKSLVFKNVAIGEVWICLGQSNLGWSAGNSFEFEKELDVNLPHFRIFKSAREHWHAPLELNRDRLCRWKPCDTTSAAETSAVAYYFGKTLQLELGVPVGIIQRAYAGTPIEGWLPWEIQQQDPRAATHKSNLDQNAQRQIRNRGETPVTAMQTFRKELDLYHAKIDSGEIMKNRFKPLAPPTITKPANLGHQYPGHIFNAMVYPIRPYGIRGMIWYQGERNSKDSRQAEHYQTQLTQLIRFYRKTWHEHSGGNVPDDFPFQFTQLPSWTHHQQQPVEGITAPWAVNRESMRQVNQSLPNTGMVVTIDTGDPIELHPRNKKPIGLRHAYLALQQTYDKRIVGQGPQLVSQRILENKIILTFDSTGTGLMGAPNADLNAFAISGNDQVWTWAKTQIQGNTLAVWSDQVPHPVAVRYAWAMNPSRKNLLYNREGFPASPFRTDTWGFYKDSDPIITVRKPEKPNAYQSVDWVRPLMHPQPNSPD
ncbi:MAG: sialate O-acetylesterase [Planctomycetota bacterium]|nr:sialate O-acetylesterase [Planctomycetota bacterium]